MGILDNKVVLVAGVTLDTSIGFGCSLRMILSLILVLTAPRIFSTA